MRKPKRLFKKRRPMPLLDLSHVAEQQPENDKVTGVIHKLRRDLDEMEWPPEADVDMLKLACANAVLNCLVNETRKGFAVAPVAEIVIKDKHPLLTPVPDDVISGDEIGRFFSLVLGKALNVENAEQVRMAFLNDEGRRLNIIAASVKDLVCWIIEGRIEGTTFVRTEINSYLAPSSPEELRAAAREQEPPLVIKAHRRRSGDGVSPCSGCKELSDINELAQHSGLCANCYSKGKKRGEHDQS